MQQNDWKDSYNIGDATIDEQHRHLFDLANTLLQASDKAALTDAAMNLYRCVREHFRDEEDLMRRIAYPGYRQHVQMHDQLLDQLNIVSAGIGAGRWRAESLHEFMNEWLVGHILEQDARLAEYVKVQAPASTVSPFAGAATR